MAVRFEDRSTARAEVVGDDRDASLVALPDGFQVRNAPTATAVYRVIVPRSLESVVIQVAGRIRAEASADTVVAIQE